MNECIIWKTWLWLKTDLEATYRDHLPDGWPWAHHVCPNSLSWHRQSIWAIEIKSVVSVEYRYRLWYGMLLCYIAGDSDIHTFQRNEKSNTASPFTEIAIRINFLTHFLCMNRWLPFFYETWNGFDCDLSPILWRCSTTWSPFESCHFWKSNVDSA